MSSLFFRWGKKVLPLTFDQMTDLVFIKRFEYLTDDIQTRTTRIVAVMIWIELDLITGDRTVTNITPQAEFLFSLLLILYYFFPCLSSFSFEQGEFPPSSEASQRGYPQ